MNGPVDPADRAAVAFAIVAAALIATAGIVGLFEPTETRYAEIAREMRSTGEYVIPHLDGIAHLHKPPFAYWAVALGMSAFGENSWGARLPVALATIATLAFAWVAFRRRFAALGASPALALWALGTMALPFALGRTVATDPFLAATVAGFWAFAPSAGALALLGLGFFVKGPVVLVLTLLPVLAAAAWSRDREPLRLLGPGRGWLQFLGIALPWFVLAALRVPGLLGYLLSNQIWARYTTDIHHRGGPPWYFIGVLAAGSLPWTAAMVAGIAGVLRSPARAEARLLVCWLAAPLVFFSFSGSKLPAYLLPCWPAAALLVAVGLGDAGRTVRLATAAILAMLAIAGAWLGPRALAQAIGAGEAVSLPRAALVGLALWAYAAVWVLRSRPAWAGLTVLAGWIGLLVGLARYEGPLGSPRELANVLAESRAQGEPIVEYHRFNAGLSFYLRAPVRLLDVERELFFTPEARRVSVLIARDSLPALAARHGRVWILAPRGEAESLADSLGLSHHRVADWRGRTLGFVELRAPEP